MNHESNPAPHRLLGSNVAPNAREAAFFQLQIDDIASEISLLRSRLAELEDQLQSHRAVLSPVRRIPAEVLGEIFVQVLPDLLQADARDSLVEMQLVCKSWRNAARLSHKLWSALSFKDLANVPYKKVKQWFDRSGNIPKSLAYSTVSHDDCMDQSIACGSLQSSSLATLLVSLEGTLDHLSLGYRGPRCFHNLLDSLGRAEEGPLSLQRRSWHPLRSFTLKFDQEWISLPNPLRSMFLQLPPNMTSFELHLPSKYSAAFENRDDSTNVPLPLPQNLLERLSTFTLRCDWDGTRWLEAALGHCVNVETLTVDFIREFWWEYRSERLLNSGLLLPKLRTLRLQNVVADTIDVLQVLKAPQLVELDIDFDTDEQHYDWELSKPLLSFIERSKCDTTLRLFHLRYACIRTQDLSATLCGLPFLTHLTLEGISTETSFIEASVQREHGLGPLLPNLETLDFLQLQPDFVPYPLLKFLKARREYHLENGKPVFTNPQDTLKQLTVTYQKTTKKNQELDKSEVVEVLRKWGGVFVNIGPILYVD